MKRLAKAILAQRVERLREEVERAEKEGRRLDLQILRDQLADLRDDHMAAVLDSLPSCSDCLDGECRRPEHEG